MKASGRVPAALREALGVPAGSEEAPAGAFAVRTVSVLFSDLHGFTKLSAELDPPDLLAFLNQCLAHLVPPIHAAGGWVDKFIGDGVMALFDSPEADAALDAALGMQHGLADLNGVRVGVAQAPLAMTIGIHTGSVVVGTLGADGRLDLTAIGEAVNTAARVHGLCGQRGAAILVSDASVKALADPIRFKLAPVEPAVLKGLPVPLDLHTLHA